MSSHDAESVAQRNALGHVGAPEEELRSFELLSHEVRTPLTVLMAGSEILQDRFEDGELGAVVDAMRRAARRIDRIVDGLTTAFEEAGSRRLGRLADVLHRVSDSLPGEQRLRLTVECPTEVGSAHVPIDQVTAILDALVDNAFKFSPPGESVSIRAEATADHLTMTVVDHGPGLQEGDASVVFDAFRQADMRSVREHDGLGLGLFAARRTARSIGGDVVIGNGSDGAAVTLSLPLGVEPALSVVPC